MEIQCDLILLSWNHLELTQPCLESLFRTTDVPCRLILVDNGSEPAVRAFLRAVRPAGAIREVVLCENETNEGFPKGMNHGLRASTAPYVCLLNNDLRFTAGWLSKMLEVARAHPEIGVLNPTSNTFGNHPPKGMPLDDYAKTLESRRGLYVEVGMCIGFCLLVTRAVLDRIGVLTEEVDRIFFEDEDFCMRAKAAGVQCVVVEGAYVFHAEHKTLRPSPEREALFNRNRQWCEQRWGKRLRIACVRFTEVRPDAEGMRPWLEWLISLARHRTLVYVYCPLPTGLGIDQLFRQVGLVPHANISWHRLPRWGTAAAAVGAVLKRQKKRFDVVVWPGGRGVRLMRWLRMIHRAEVVGESSADTFLRQVWETRFPAKSWRPVTT